MSAVSGGFFDEVNFFVENHKLLCIATLGLALIGYSIGNLAGRAVSWINECTGTTKKTDAVSREILSSSKETSFANPRSSEPLSDQDHENLISKAIIEELFDMSKSSHETPPLSSSSSKTQQLRAEYNALKEKNSSPLTESIYVIPERRVCGFGGMENLATIRKAKKAVFVTNEEIIKIHPMKFLSNSPFVVEDDSDFKELEGEAIWSNILDSTKKQAQAIGVTEGGKHVILQQAAKSCVPTCMAMLILDFGKKPNYEAIRFTYLATTERAIEWAKEAELTCQVTQIPKENVIEILSKCLAEKGPGMLSIDHPTIDGHVVILDEISIEKNEAIIRDSFHGWMVTMALDALKAWLRPGGKFVQIV